MTGLRRFIKPVQLPVGVGIEEFHCGVNTIDSWAANYSSVARKRGTAVIYASYCVSTAASKKVAGFYTLSTHSVTRGDISGGWLARNTPTQIPAILLGMLAVDESFQGHGLGAALLRDALINALKVANLAGAKALIVDPINNEARNFYAHFGFSELAGTSRMACKLL